MLEMLCAQGSYAGTFGGSRGGMPELLLAHEGVCRVFWKLKGGGCRNFWGLREGYAGTFGG